MIWALAARAASPCADAPDACACEHERAEPVRELLTEAEDSALGRRTAPAWRAAVEATCDWAASLGGADPCVATAVCVRAMAESRLRSLSPGTAAAWSAELAALTGRASCRPDAGPACANAARAAADDRLRVVVDALDGRGFAPLDAQRYWLGYRDDLCAAHAEVASSDSSWARAACEAATSALRADVLAELTATGSLELGGLVADARLRAARSGGRPWRAWLAEVGPAGRDPLRRALEARQDGVIYPPLLASPGWSACAAEGNPSCLDALRADTRRARDAVAPPLASDSAEARWRRRWCGDPGAPACEATIDLVVAETLRPAP